MLTDCLQVFFSSCNCVKYHAELLNYIDLPVLELHGKQKQQKRTNTFFEFCNADQGTLICTDVAARGLDVRIALCFGKVKPNARQIPAVDWIIQFDPPDDPKDYIHRVGRTARGANGRGRSLMFLQPSEVGFLKHLREARVPVVEFEFPAQKIVNVQSQLEKLIGQNYYLNKVSQGVLSMPNHVLMFHAVCQGRIPRLSPSVCVALAPNSVRRAQAGSCQGSQGVRVPDAAAH
jgi:ATP-dependent RNA helicase DDX18/HAS1